MKNMYTVLGLNCHKYEEEFGVEIEVEGRQLPQHYSAAFDNLWRVERDGSLRGAESAEYVSLQPYDLAGVRNALDVLDAEYEANKSQVSESLRAGVHIHLNVQEWAPLELLTFATTYYILEGMFIQWAGNGRIGNHFCLRARDAQGVVGKLEQACQKKDWRYLNTDDIRYSALNWNSMFKYGSIEFRSMRSTRDLNAIYRWVELINQLKIGAKKFNNPREVIGAVSEFAGPERFMKHVMGDLSHEFEPFGDLGVWEGLRLVQPLAFMTDWERFNKGKINPFKMG